MNEATRIIIAIEQGDIQYVVLLWKPQRVEVLFMNS